MDPHRDRLAIEFISVLGLPPLDFVDLATDLGCRHIGIALEPIVRSKAHPMWSLRDDALLRRDTVSAIRRAGISITLGEGFIAWPHRDIRDAGPDLDLMCELGAAQVNLVNIDRDRSRAFDQCAIFAEMAGSRGLGATLEFMPGLPIGDLESAAAAVRHAGEPNFRLLIDAMHFFRSGSKVSQVAALDPRQIGHVQLCDVPLASSGVAYADEARFARLPPGKGELPLLDLLVALPQNMIFGMEVPMLAEAERGIGPRERLSRCIEATWDLMQRAEARRRATPGPA